MFFSSLLSTPFLLINVDAKLHYVIFIKVFFSKETDKQDAGCIFQVFQTPLTNKRKHIWDRFDYILTEGTFEGWKISYIFI